MRQITCICIVWAWHQNRIEIWTILSDADWLWRGPLLCDWSVNYQVQGLHLLVPDWTVSTRTLPSLVSFPPQPLAKSSRFQSYLEMILNYIRLYHRGRVYILRKNSAMALAQALEKIPTHLPWCQAPALYLVQSYFSLYMCV